MNQLFAVGRQSGTTLVDQLVERIRRAIASGHYKENERLPGIREMAEQAGVSEKVSRAAFKLLAEQGWVVTRPHVGSVVAKGAAELNVRGRVLLFNTSDCYGYYAERLLSTLRAHLIGKGYRLMAISVAPATVRGRYAELEALLKERWSLVLENGMDPPSRKLIEEAGWPFVIIGNGRASVPSKADNCRGIIGIRSGLAVSEFVLACVRKNVRTVVQFLYGEGAYDVSERLAMPGIKTKTIRIPGKKDLTSVAEAAFAETKKIVRTGAFPDVLLYTDDHLARGGLMALSAAGVRVPEDVRVVTHVNKGFAPVWPTALTCLQMDPHAHGCVLARQVLDLLNGRTDALNGDLGSSWVAGETF